MQTRTSLALIAVALVVIGLGCLNRNAPPILPLVEEPPVSTTEPVEGMIGLVQSVDTKKGTAEVMLVDGSIEIVYYGDPNDLPVEIVPGVNFVPIGDLVKFDGTRDRSTRIIDVSQAGGGIGNVNDNVSTTPNIVVVSPNSDATIASPLIVTGFARATGNAFFYRMRGFSGTEIETGPVGIDSVSPDQFGRFALEVFLPNIGDKDFSLELFDRAKDGSETDLVSLPLHLISTATTTFSVYFSNAKKSPYAVCELVFPVERTIAQTSAVGRAALLELLKGPTKDELALGYRTNLPVNVDLRSLVISDSTATADFTGELNYVAGSCRVLAIRSQIMNTLNQLEGVDTVEIKANGETETILQP